MFSRVTGGKVLVGGTGGDIEAERTEERTGNWAGPVLCGEGIGNNVWCEEGSLDIRQLGSKRIGKD